MTLIQSFTKAVVKLTPLQRSEIVSAIEKANEADYQKIVFGDKRPTIAGLKKYLREHASDKMEDADKVTVAKAINFFRRKFGAVLVFQTDDGKKVRCTLTSQRNVVGDTEYQRRFRLLSSGKTPVTIYGRNALPELFLEKM